MRAACISKGLSIDVHLGSVFERTLEVLVTVQIKVLHGGTPEESNGTHADVLVGQLSLFRTADC